MFISLCFSPACTHGSTISGECHDSLEFWFSLLSDFFIERMCKLLGFQLTDSIMAQIDELPAGGMMRTLDTDPIKTDESPVGNSLQVGKKRG